MVRKMSDPVSNAEIEDVLSSIRRLVSEECRSKPREAATAALSLEDRLVLTPALRVAEPEDRAEMPDARVEHFVGQDLEKAASPASDTDELNLSEGSVGTDEPSNDRDGSAEDIDRFQFDRIDFTETIEAEVEENEANEDGSAQPDDVKGSDAALSTPEVESAPEISRDADFDVKDEDVKGLYGIELEDPEQPVPEPGFGQVDEALTLERSAAEPHVGSPLKVEETLGFEALIKKNAHANSDRDLPVRPLGQEATGTRSDSVSGQPEAKPSLGVKAAILEAAIGKTRDQWEPDDIGSDDYSGTKVRKMDWVDDEGAQSSRQERDARAPSPDDQLSDEREPDLSVKPDTSTISSIEDQVDPSATMETVLDEDSLRELVADIVREELQGPLGERITRNVRKLVRREIHRALSVQDLE